MEAGIVGLPNVGKSIANALTAAGIEAANYPFCTIEPNVGVVTVPDDRLTVLNKHIPTTKVIPAIIRLVDIAGLVRGASEGEGLGNKFLSHIREVDAILHVVRCFENADIVHVEGPVIPSATSAPSRQSWMLADLQIIEGLLEKNQRIAKSGDKEAIAKVALLSRCKECLDASRPIRSLALDAEDRKQLQSLGMISAMPVLFVANVDETDPTGQGPLVQKVHQYAAENGGKVVVVCAKIESELSELGEADRAELLKELGMKELALHSVARAAYELLGLQSYFTAGVKEIRAWTIHKASRRPRLRASSTRTLSGASSARRDLHRGRHGEVWRNEKAIREAGRMRSEGKNYVMQDGDVCHFLFNT